MRQLSRLFNSTLPPGSVWVTNNQIVCLKTPINFSSTKIIFPEFNLRFTTKKHHGPIKVNLAKGFRGLNIIKLKTPNTCNDFVETNVSQRFDFVFGVVIVHLPRVTSVFLKSATVDDGGSPQVIAVGVALDLAQKVAEGCHLLRRKGFKLPTTKCKKVLAICKALQTRQN